MATDGDVCAYSACYLQSPIVNPFVLTCRSYVPFLPDWKNSLFLSAPVLTLLLLFLFLTVPIGCFLLASDRPCSLGKKQKVRYPKDATYNLKGMSLSSVIDDSHRVKQSFHVSCCWYYISIQNKSFVKTKGLPVLTTSCTEMRSSALLAN